MRFMKANDNIVVQVSDEERRPFESAVLSWNLLQTPKDHSNLGGNRILFENVDIDLSNSSTRNDKVIKSSP